MVNFKDFIADMRVSGFVSSERIDDSLFQYKLPVARFWIEALRYNLKIYGSGRISYKDAYYRLSAFEPAIYSTAPFNVTGFTGDDAQMGVDALTEMLDSIKQAIAEFKSGNNHASLDGTVFLVRPPEIARHFARKWCYEAVDYIREHLCYGMFEPLWPDPAALDSSDSLVYWSKTLGHPPFEDVFTDVDGLIKLPGMLNFKKMLRHFERAFSSYGYNTDVYKAASDVFTGSYARRRIYKKHDIFSVSWSNDFEQVLFFDRENKQPLAICDTRIDEAGAPINRWLHGFNCVLMDAGEHAVFGDFLKGFCDLLEKDDCRGNNAVDCGNFKVRFCQDHLNITVPHKYVLLIERFLAKYGFDFGLFHKKIA